MLPNNLDNAQKLKHFIELGRSTSDAANHLLENLLFWAYNSTGTLKAVHSKFSVSAVAYEVLQMVQSAAERKSIELEADISSSRAETGDKQMIETVLRNLLLNAIKFSPEGGRVRLHVSSEMWSTKVQVIDEGVGIPADKLALIKAGNSHYNTPGTNNERGSGIGLMVCQQLLKMNKSGLDIDSEYGKGTTVSFVLWDSDPRNQPPTG